MTDTTSLALRAAFDSLSEGKAQRCLVLDLRGRSILTDYFIICHGSSERQVRSLAEQVQQSVRQQTDRKPSIEGLQSAEWVLLDYGDFVVHIFNENAREFYRLEDLWFDATSVDPATLAG